MRELFVINGINAGMSFPVGEEPLLVGRAPDCPIQISDAWVSSRHARLEMRGGETWVVDLGSSNGTWMDDVRVGECRLLPGSQVRFGKTAVELRELALPLDLATRHGTLVRPLAAVRHTANDVEGEATAVALAAARRQVAVVNQIGRELVDATDLEASLERILTTVARALRTEHACLLTIEEGRWEPRAWDPVGEAPRFSLDLVDAAARGRVGVVTFDPAQAQRPCLCAPIWAERRVLGMLVLYRTPLAPFTAEDLELATVVGYQAALAIERVRVLEGARAIDQERRKLLRHFSPDIAQLILAEEQQEQDPLEATEREDVTVLFSDVKGFTGLTERLAPLELSALLRTYFRSMTEAIFEFGGTLDKFIGDGIMAVFGAPVPQPDGAVRAVRCAWAMLERLSELNAAQPEDRRLSIRIGINTGRVIAGNVGTEERLEFTVLGDTVNTAARLESAAPVNGILVGPGTCVVVEDAFELQPLGALRLRGRSAPVEAWRVLGPR